MRLTIINNIVFIHRSRSLSGSYVADGGMLIHPTSRHRSRK